MPPVLPPDDHGRPLPPHDNPRSLSRAPRVHLKVPSHESTLIYTSFDVRMTHLYPHSPLPRLALPLTQALVQVAHHLAGLPRTSKVRIDRRIIIKHDAFDPMADVPLVPVCDLIYIPQRERLHVVDVVKQDDAPALVAPNEAPQSLQQSRLPPEMRRLALQHDEPLGLGKLVRLEALEQPGDRLFRGHHVANDRRSNRRGGDGTHRVNASSAAAGDVAPRVALVWFEFRDSIGLTEEDPGIRLGHRGLSRVRQRRVRIA